MTGFQDQSCHTLFLFGHAILFGICFIWIYNSEAASLSTIKVNLGWRVSRVADTASSTIPSTSCFTIPAFFVPEKIRPERARL